MRWGTLDALEAAAIIVAAAGLGVSLRSLADALRARRRLRTAPPAVLLVGRMHVRTALVRVAGGIAFLAAAVALGLMPEVPGGLDDFVTVVIAVAAAAMAANAAYDRLSRRRIVEATTPRQVVREVRHAERVG